ncbi:MAG: protein-glutamate O-methyltransferase CheR [Bacteroidales bacterium]|nr:protein-glutamate O-methyltransferase CheR [Bacteroidales bacterium]MDD3011215.1 protein-glutamate O-methyltransferase CheR [Bacteroidales bacterium]HPE87330.1 protein-glutamate O-methyltransferase CheR [Bacteroidales bacterium]
MDKKEDLIITPQQLETEEIELELLLEAIYRKYGYDFRNYGKAHIKRRIKHRQTSASLESISMMQHQVLHNENFFELLLRDLSINVTEMFRDPGFYATLRQEVIPVLKTYPFIKIWHAGCSTGEEVYSMAILLQEEGLLNRVQIYATDFNQAVLQKAREGIFPIDRIKEYTLNYQKSGGKKSFSNYYTAHYNSVIMNADLKKNVVFADHNLVTDSVFAEVNLIICRNVLIYFDKELQDKVIHLFNESLTNGGILCLGSKENLRFSSSFPAFQPINEAHKIYRKKYTP